MKEWCIEYLKTEPDGREAKYGDNVEAETPEEALSLAIERHGPSARVVGEFMLSLPAEGMTCAEADDLCRMLNGQERVPIPETSPRIAQLLRLHAQDKSDADVLYMLGSEYEKALDYQEARRWYYECTQAPDRNLAHKYAEEALGRIGWPT